MQNSNLCPLVVILLQKRATKSRWIISILDIYKSCYTQNLILSNSMNWLHILAVIHDLISLLFTIRAQHRVQVLLLQTGMSCYYKELKNTKNVIMISQIDHRYL